MLDEDSDDPADAQAAWQEVSGILTHLLNKPPLLDTGQINEALCKMLTHNICVLVQAIHELGIEPVFFAPAQAANSAIR